MNKPLRVVALCLAASLCSGMLSGCGPASASRNADTLVALEPDDANTTNPFFVNNAPAFLYDYFVFDALAENGPNLSVVPALATHWSASKDFLHYTVDLRENAPWSDGVPFTADDVVFTWEKTLDPKVGDPYAGQFDFIKKVVELGPHRVRFDLSRRFAAFVNLVLGATIVPKHCFDGVSVEEYRKSPFGEHPIGNGPYKLVSWDHDNQVTFERYGAYWRGPAKIKNLVVKIVLNADQYGEALHEGSGDLAEITSSTEYRKLSLNPGALKFVHVPDLFERWIMINLRKPGLNDRAVRQAMNYGWDRADLAKGLFHGDERPDDTVTPFGLAYYHDSNIQPYDYDPPRARKLLDDAGWKPGPEGIRAKNGVRLQFDLALASAAAGSGQADAMSAFKSDMQAVGIGIDLDLLDYPTFIDKTSDFEYEMAYSGWGGSTDPDQYTFFHSSQAPPVGNNDTGYANPKIDKLLVAGQVATSPAERRTIYDEMQRITTYDAPVVFGYDDYYRVVLNPRVDVRGDHEPDLNFWWNVYDWRLRS